MHETDLKLEPNEASDLCRVFAPRRPRAPRLGPGVRDVLDEAPAEEALALLVHRAGAPLEEGGRRCGSTPTRLSDGGRTEDAEACAARDGHVYVARLAVRQEGRAAGRPALVDRPGERGVAGARRAGERAELEIARLRFGLHRAVNDALAAAGVELLPLGPSARDAYVDATIAIGDRKAKRWAGRITAADHPINVEAAEFRADGRLLLGLRYPVTAEGHPILVELDDVDGALRRSRRRARLRATLGARGRRDPRGARRPARPGQRRGRPFDAVVGDLDASGKSATVLEDHPHGALAASSTSASRSRSPRPVARWAATSSTTSATSAAWRA